MTQFAYDVVIPTHGRTLGLLHETVESVFRQTIPPQGVIIVVDGNTAAVDSIQVRWPDAVVLDHPGPSGEAAARQAGIAATSAEWVCFIDDDDLWPSYKSEVTAAYLSGHPDCDAVRATYMIFAAEHYANEMLNGQYIDIRGNALDELEVQARGLSPRNDFAYLDIRGQSLARLMDRNRSVIGTTCVRRHVLSRLPAVPPGTRPGADYVLACLVATQTEWHLIDQPLMFYRLHAAQDSRTPDPRGVLGILAARATAWRLCGPFVQRRLSDYGPAYRREFRSLIWPLVRDRHVREAISAVRHSFELLPRWRDRALLMIPEPIVWRWRYGRHRGRLTHSGITP
ncbi:glycosyltransferase family A protein [uncultured Microbacterium sp.]|uniref:glycosyltransferase family A protein n=1 Tax=uncultured Microbacterium sp. TaxID=191216 RepID=UPI0028D4F070|nr:glycosyltransferase family A protein [uncultured Microbacterium sp.]